MEVINNINQKRSDKINEMRDQIQGLKQELSVKELEKQLDDLYLVRSNILDALGVNAESIADSKAIELEEIESALVSEIENYLGS